MTVLDIELYLPLLVKGLLIWYYGWNTSLLTAFIVQNMHAGSIFYFWQVFISKKFGVSSPLQTNQPFGYKILGGCPTCTNIWIGFITFPFIYYFCNLKPIEYLPYLIIFSCISNHYLIKNK
jgi:hypothetical protein